MIRIILMWIVVIGYCLGNGLDQNLINRYYKQLERLDTKQLKIMIFSYQMGKEHDLGYSLAAIAWKESNFGKFLINLQDGEMGSYGVYHILLQYAVARNKIKSDWDISRYAEQLVFDNELCANEAISELLFWLKYHKRHNNKWRRMFASYNAGTYGIDTAKGKLYADDAVHRVRALEKFFKDKKILERLEAK